jgi:putative membrane protein (TIGR04086 family)
LSLRFFFIINVHRLGAKGERDMTTNKKVFGKAGSMPLGLAAGTAVGLLVTIAFAVVMAQLVLGGKLKEGAMGYGAMIAIPVSAAIGALVSVAIIKRRRMQVCLITGAAYLLSLIGINILFFGGQFQGLVVTVLLILLGTGGIGALGLRNGKRKGKRHRR